MSANCITIPSLKLTKIIQDKYNKAPRLGLEPRTFMLTACCTTIVLSWNINKTKVNKIFLLQPKCNPTLILVIITTTYYNVTLDDNYYTVVVNYFYHYLIYYDQYDVYQQNNRIHHIHIWNI